jgi:hypothetical protein
MIPLSPVYSVPFGIMTLGSPFVIIGLISRRKSTAIGTWPQVKGRIVSSQLRTSTDDDGESYSVDARFSYEVGGKTYERDTISREGIFGAKAQPWVDSHPPGSEVTVYVDPRDPATAYLEWKRWTIGSIAMLAWGGVMISIGLLVLVIFLLVTPS